MAILSIATDYVVDYGCPEPYLRRIADAGFSHVHWCHHWCHDFIYEECELEQLGKWLDALGLKILDMHASLGGEKNWASPREYERVAGENLVRNRLEMAARFGTDVIVMHTGREPVGEDEKKRFWEQLRKSLDKLAPDAGRLGVRIAIENGEDRVIDRLLEEYPPEYVGICYDSGHGNQGKEGSLGWLEKNKDRLISMHLHDNDGESDLHKIPFTGTIDWERLARIVAESSYDKCMNLECLKGRSGIEDEAEFLAASFEAGMKFSEMVERCRV